MVKGMSFVLEAKPDNSEDTRYLVETDKEHTGDDPLPQLALQYQVKEADTQVSVSTGNLSEHQFNEMPYVKLQEILIMELPLYNQDRSYFKYNGVEGEAKVQIVTVHQSFLVLKPVRASSSQHSMGITSFPLLLACRIYTSSGSTEIHRATNSCN
jgi:hypothetical protein